MAIGAIATGVWSASTVFVSAEINDVGLQFLHFGEFGGEDLSAGPIEEIFGTPVQTNNDMVKVVIGRIAKMHGAGVGNAQNRAFLNCAEISNPRPDDAW